MDNTNNILSFLDTYMLEQSEAVDAIAKSIAADFRRRRIEKNMTREEVAAKAEVAVSNIVRFEQTGLISLKNLIGIARAMNYTGEVKKIFSEPKYDTMDELLEIRKNMKKKKASKG